MFIPQQPKVLIQGITGKEGQRALQFMTSAGTPVVAGVTPGKGGQTVQQVPVYNSIAEAFKYHPDINVSTLYVPPRFLKAAFVELAEVIRQRSLDQFFVHLITENVPLHDAAFILELARQLNITVLGPSSIGMILPGQYKIGSIGGLDNSSFTPGPIAILSKSGGLSSEVSLITKFTGYGQSLVAGIGGDILIGSSFHDFFPYLEADSRTRLVILIGEIGGTYEQQAAQAIQQKVLTKPVIAFIAGLFTQTLPQGVALGHAGAFIDGPQATREAKRQAFQQVGVHLADSLEDIPRLISQLL